MSSGGLLNRTRSEANIVPSYLTNVLARNRHQNRGLPQHGSSDGGFDSQNGRGNYQSDDNGLRSLSTVSSSDQMEKGMAPTVAMSAPSTAAEEAVHETLGVIQMEQEQFQTAPGLHKAAELLVRALWMLRHVQLRTCISTRLTNRSLWVCNWNSEIMACESQL